MSNPLHYLIQPVPDQKESPVQLVLMGSSGPKASKETSMPQTQPTEALAAEASKLNWTIDEYHSVIGADGRTVELNGFASVMAGGDRQRQSRARTRVIVEVLRAFPALLASHAAQAAQIEQLRLAICGGEDAPGYAMSLPLQAILDVQADNMAVSRSSFERCLTLEARLVESEAREGALIAVMTNIAIRGEGLVPLLAKTAAVAAYNSALQFAIELGKTARAALTTQGRGE